MIIYQHKLFLVTRLTFLHIIFSRKKILFYPIKRAASPDPLRVPARTRTHLRCGPYFVGPLEGPGLMCRQSKYSFLNSYPSMFKYVHWTGRSSWSTSENFIYMLLIIRIWVPNDMFSWKPSLNWLGIRTHITPFPGVIEAWTSFETNFKYLMDE